MENEQSTPITLNLDERTVNIILAALGELPTKSGVWDLILEIQRQGREQLPS